MSFRSIVSSVCIASLALTLVGCGSSTKITSTNEVSVGQQLTDLDRARAQGLITEREYKRLKNALIKRYS